MPISIAGSGTITGISVGGIPDGVVDTDVLAANAVTAAKLGSAEASGLAKAWVNFNGTGAVAIRASYNVSSITDNGTGDYTVNFTTAMADANYWVGGMTDRGIGGPGGTGSLTQLGTDNNTSYNYLTASSARVSTSRNIDNTHFDSLIVCVAIFR
jgi:hypothetical protein